MVSKNMTSVVIVNYMKYEDTIAAVDSVLKSKTEYDHTVIVVDNASPNESYEILHDRYCKNADITNDPPRVVVLQARENLGYCAGNNVGIRYAIDELRSEYIWILNPDTLVESYTFQNYINYLNDHEDVGIVGAKLIFYPDSEHMQAYGGGRFGVRKSLVMGPFMHYFKDAPVDTELPPEIELDVAIGASMMVRVDVFKKIGLMNEEYFLYSDENEFCLRAKKAGYRITAIRDAVVYHKEGYRQNKQTLMAEYYITRNSLYMVKELYPKYFPIHYFFTAIISSDTIRKSLQGRKDLVKMKKKGIRDYRCGIKGMVEINN